MTKEREEREYAIQKERKKRIYKDIKLYIRCLSSSSLESKEGNGKVKKKRGGGDIDRKK